MELGLFEVECVIHKVKPKCCQDLDLDLIDVPMYHSFVISISGWPLGLAQLCTSQSLCVPALSSMIFS